MLTTSSIENISIPSRLVRFGLGLVLLAPIFEPQSWNPQAHSLIVLFATLPIFTAIVGYCPFVAALYSLAQGSLSMLKLNMSLLLVVAASLLMGSFIFVSNEDIRHISLLSMPGVYPIIMAIYAVEIIGTVINQLNLEFDKDMKRQSSSHNEEHSTKKEIPFSNAA